MAEQARRSGRTGVRRWPALAHLALAVGTALGAPTVLAAQVGHPPAESPFRDFATAQGLTFSTGWFFGDETEAGVGAQASTSFALQLNTRLSGPIDLLATLVYIPSSRYVVDPNKPVATRVSGPIPYGLFSAELGLGLNLTGAKSWHRLAPYVGLGIGVMIPTDPTTDPGGYKAGTNFTFAPAVGMRYVLSRSFALQFEAKDNTIRYEWPLDYFRPGTSQGTNLPYDPVLDPTRYDDRDTTHNFTLSAGLSYRFNF